jgi:hypothetical protein
VNEGSYEGPSGASPGGPGGFPPRKEDSYKGQASILPTEPVTKQLSN